MQVPTKKIEDNGIKPMNMEIVSVVYAIKHQYNSNLYMLSEWSFNIFLHTDQLYLLSYVSPPANVPICSRYRLEYVPQAVYWLGLWTKSARSPSMLKCVERDSRFSPFRHWVPLDLQTGRSRCEVVRGAHRPTCPCDDVLWCFTNQ